MKTFLMHRDRDFDLQGALPWNEPALRQDLALETLLGAMARGDKIIRDVAARAVLTAWRNGPETILHRQAVLQDGLDNPTVLRELYGLAVEAIEEQRKHYYGIWGRLPSSLLYNATESMQSYVAMLRRLHGIGRAHAGRFRSEGFTRFFGMLERELTEEYLARIEAHLAELKFRGGTLISARLGPGNAGRDYLLHQSRKDDRHWLVRLLSRHPPGYVFRLAERDQAGAQALSELRNRGIDLVANALAQSADHVESFFQMLRTELAFYVGCLNLHETLTGLGEPTCFPRPRLPGERRLRCRGLYDPCLALQMERAVVGNDVGADGKDLVVVTGANQGGKSVFLRSVGVAQIMMQSGMFVGAEAFEGEQCSGLVTHYTREEDAALKSGKFAEELARLSEIVDHLTPNTMLLFNESFAATNEREGSEIARQVVSALLETGMRVFFVTHLHAFARDFFDRERDQTLFLRAERRPDGTRTFRVIEGEPRATSHGKDLFDRIFEGR